MPPAMTMDVKTPYNLLRARGERRRLETGSLVGVWLEVGGRRA